MDTFRDKQILDELEASGEAPWCLWKMNSRAARGCSVIRLTFSRKTDPGVVLCLGAHSDDIEIGCGGTCLYLRSAWPG